MRTYAFRTTIPTGWGTWWGRSQPLGLGGFDDILERGHVTCGEALRRLLNVIICTLKLRKFEISHRDSATKRLRWWVFMLTRTLCIFTWGVLWLYKYHLAWAGLRCLSLTGGNAKAWTQGWAEVETPHAFFIFHTFYYHFAEQGVFRAVYRLCLRCCSVKMSTINVRVEHIYILYVIWNFQDTHMSALPARESREGLKGEFTAW